MPVLHVCSTYYPYIVGNTRTLKHVVGRTIQYAVVYTPGRDNPGPGGGPSAPGERVRRIGWMKQGREGPVWSTRALRSVWHADPSIFWRWGGLLVSYSGFSPEILVFY